MEPLALGTRPPGFPITRHTGYFFPSGSTPSQVPVVHASRVQHPTVRTTSVKAATSRDVWGHVFHRHSMPRVPIHELHDEEGVALVGGGPEVHRVHAQQVVVGCVGEEGGRLPRQTPVAPASRACCSSVRSSSVEETGLSAIFRV